MASISHDSTNGRRTIQFVAADGKRKSIRLGKVSKKVADAIMTKVEHLNAAVISGCSIDNETADWVAKLGEQMAAKLAKVGLIQVRQSAVLGTFLDELLKRRGTDKRRTRLSMEAGRDRLTQFFGKDRVLRTITPGNGDAYFAWLKERYAKTTAARTFRRARQFFRAAVRSHLLSANPFDGVKTPSEVDTSKQRFITHEDIRKVIEECPNADLRLIVALARFGGLRIPSEYVSLTWADILWDKDRIRITSPKTEHHEGRGERMVPLFPELRSFLQEGYEAAPDGAVYVIGDAYRKGDINLRTALHRAIRRAGLTPWPKLFVNLRSSRETELVETHPLHVVTAWLGNTARIAQKHYLQVTDEHFARAAQSGADALQKAVQHGTAAAGTETQTSAQLHSNCELAPYLATRCDDLQYTRQDSNQSAQVSCGERHLRQDNQSGAAQSGAVNFDVINRDADLAFILEAWPRLSGAMRRAMRVIAESADA